MALAWLRLVLTIGAGVALWYVWTRSAKAGPRVAAVVGAGFLLRVILGQALFWISWLGLPIGQSLQLGNGFWVFALDAEWYLRNAEELLGRGLPAVFLGPTVHRSHAFVQIVALCSALFGHVASVAILLNGAAYLATCAIIVRLAGPGRRAGWPCVAALAALAFGPAAMLWSAQLLKDTVLLFLAVAMIGAFRSWQGFWMEEAPATSRLRLGAVVAGLFACAYALAGMRWYLALLIWLASAWFFALVGWRALRRRPALAASAVVFVLLGQVVRVGGGTDIPGAIRRFMDPSPLIAMTWRPSDVMSYLAEARTGFENTPGGTTIAPGPLLGPADRAGVVAHLIARLTALLLPRAAGQAMGLVHIDGGRGFWLFAELDTIAFDAVLVWAVLYCITALASSRSPVPPLFVLLVLVGVMLLPAMAYTVNNFGTLLRLRQMLYVIAALTPLTFAARRRA